MRGREKGFTFIEVMIASAIMMLLTAAVLAVLSSGDRILNNDMGLVELQQKARQALHGMSRELRQADASALTYNSSSDIQFELVDDVTDPSTPATYLIRYYLDGSIIVRENPTTGTACDSTWSDSKCSRMASNVNSLTFCCIGGTDCTDCADAHTVQIDVETGKTTSYGRALTVSLIKKVQVRND